MNQVREALKTANDQKKPPIDDLFNDVYDTVMPHLENQRKQLKEHLKKYGDNYDLDQFKNGKNYANNWDRIKLEKYQITKGSS